jgi:hypothetical protein
MKLLIALALIPATARADGVTFEANLGAGTEHYSASTFSTTSDPWFGFGASVGTWLTPRLAVMARAAGIGVHAAHPSEAGMANPEGDVFVGPSVQWWLGDHVWLGAGAGMSEHLDGTYDDTRGWGLDLRAGYAFHALELSLEVTPSYDGSGGGIGLGTDGSVTTIPAYNTGVMILAGYQRR